MWRCERRRKARHEAAGAAKASMSSERLAVEGSVVQGVADEGGGGGSGDARSSAASTTAARWIMAGVGCRGAETACSSSESSSTPARSRSAAAEAAAAHGGGNAEGRAHNPPPPPPPPPHPTNPPLSSSRTIHRHPFHASLTSWAGHGVPALAEAYGPVRRLAYRGGHSVRAQGQPRCQGSHGDGTHSHTHAHADTHTHTHTGSLWPRREGCLLYVPTHRGR
jgi:hypothetical protein